MGNVGLYIRLFILLLWWSVSVCCLYSILILFYILIILPDNRSILMGSVLSQALML